MRLKKLYIQKFKNLKSFSIDFENSYYVSVLLGKNGTGKSNLFEFLTMIFKSLDLASSHYRFKSIFLADLNQFGETVPIFSLEYTINNNLIRIEIINDTLKIRDLRRSSNIPFTQFKKSLFPEHVVGYYSGRNQRFEKLYNKHIENAEQMIINVKRAHERKATQELIAFQENRIIPENEKIKIPIESFRPLFYAKNKYSQLLLLTLFVFKDSNQAISDLLSKYLKIDGFVRFFVTLKSPKFNSTLSCYDEIEKFWGVAGSSLDCASFLYRVSERSLKLPEEEVNEMRIDSRIKEAVVLFIDANSFVENVVEEYDNDPSEMFRHLESLYLSDLLHEITLVVRRGEDEISFSNLSEGEQQMIVTLGLLIITGKKNSLYLMDEPDTHLNPKWQRDYINIIKSLVQDSDNSHILIGTHSPFMPQAVKGSDLILFKREDGHPKIHKIHNMHTWKIDQILTSELYELETTRASDIEVKLLRLDELLLKESLTEIELEEKKELDAELQNLAIGRNSEEVNTINELKEIARILKEVQ